MVSGTSSVRYSSKRVMRGALLALMIGAVCWFTFLHTLARMVAQSLLPLPKVLREANFVTIRRMGGTRYLHLSSKRNSAQLLLLKGSTVIAAPAHPHPDFVIDINIRSSTTATYQYDYISTLGQMGKDKEWCQVPSEFKAWILTRKWVAPTSGGRYSAVSEAPS